jgi:hypothetical protein
MVSVSYVVSHIHARVWSFVPGSEISYPGMKLICFHIFKLEKKFLNRNTNQGINIFNNIRH